jgi:hypothetical protein
MNKTYKVLTRGSDKAPYRTFMEFPTMAEALAVAARLRRNTVLEVIVELPDNSIEYVPLSLLELTA